ncbi:MAG: sugar kinase, partial [Thermoplasmata archaeon]|nr:sugar kinase [Thermoplasmata archaeon]
GLQKHVLEQVRNPKAVIADTMNLWIDIARDELHDLMRSVDIFVLNEKEALDLTGIEETFEAGKRLLGFGPKYIVIKKGAHGAELVSNGLFFVLPAYPVEEVVDPTGAGDCFAGGFVGYLAKCDRVDNDSLRKALGYGTVTASFSVEDFSLERLKRLTTDEIEARFEELSMMTELD